MKFLKVKTMNEVMTDAQRLRLDFLIAAKHFAWELYEPEKKIPTHKEVYDLIDQKKVEQFIEDFYLDGCMGVCGFIDKTYSIKGIRK